VTRHARPSHASIYLTRTSCTSSRYLPPQHSHQTLEHDAHSSPARARQFDSRRSCASRHYRNKMRTATTSLSRSRRTEWATSSRRNLEGGNRSHDHHHNAHRRCVAVAGAVSAGIASVLGASPPPCSIIRDHDDQRRGRGTALGSPHFASRSTASSRAPPGGGVHTWSWR